MPEFTLRGRSQEVTTGLGLLRRARASGHGGVLLIEGSPGIGKSAILAELVSQARRTPYRCGLSKADSIARMSPGASLLLALRSGRDPLLTAVDLERLQTFVSSPLLLLDELAAVLEREAASGPVLVGLDDVQWVDPVSRFVLRSIPARLSGLPVVWIFVGRAASDGLANDIKQQSFPEVPVEVITLGPLDEEDVIAMARDRLNQLPSDHLRLLLKGAAGNPFFVSQILDGVVGAPGDDGSVDIPARFILGVRQRIAEVDPAAADLMRVVAVFGRPFAVEDAEALLPDASRASVMRWLVTLEQAGLLRTDNAGRIAIAHDLVREAVYADLTDRTRRVLHRRCARYLASVDGEPLTIAAHAQAAITPGDDETAELLLRLAGEAVGAMPETAADLVLTAFHALRPDQPLWWDAGLRSLELLGLVHRCDEAIEIADVLLAHTDDADVIGQVEVAASRTLWLMNRWDAAVERSARALRRRGLSEIMRTRLAALNALARSRVESSAVVAPDARRALQSAERACDEPATVLARHALAESARNRGDHVSSLRHYRALRLVSGPTYIAQEILGLQHLDRFADAEVMLREARRDMGIDRGSIFLNLLYSQIWGDYCLGHFDGAEAGARTLFDLAVERGSLLCRTDAASLLSLVAWLRGDVAAARLRCDEALGPAGPEGERRCPSLLLVRGLVTAAEGERRQAIDLVRPVLFDGRAERDPWPWKAGWLRPLAHLGLSERDHAFTDEVVTLAELGAQRSPDVASLAGIALQLRGLVTHDVELLREAVRVLEASPRPMVRAGAEQDLGFELVARDRRRDGAEHLDAAWAIYRGIGAFGPMTGLQKQMRRAGFRRRQWQTAQPRPADGWAALTSAEVRVAELIADGYTNKAASAALGVSVNTIGTHLLAVFRKLDVQSRVQLSNLVHQKDAE
jgi:DNA-binding CsgD family transcriptional regulator